MDWLKDAAKEWGGLIASGIAVALLALIWRSLRAFLRRANGLLDAFEVEAAKTATKWDDWAAKLARAALGAAADGVDEAEKVPPPNITKLDLKR